MALSTNWPEKCHTICFHAIHIYVKCVMIPREMHLKSIRCCQGIWMLAARLVLRERFLIISAGRISTLCRLRMYGPINDDVDAAAPVYTSVGLENWKRTSGYMRWPPSRVITTSELGTTNGTGNTTLYGASISHADVCLFAPYLSLSLSLPICALLCK